jgi:glucose/mannose transport system permease protein
MSTVVTPTAPGQELVTLPPPPLRAAADRTVLWRTVRYAILIAFVIVMLMPLYVLLVTSFKAGSEIGVNGQWTLPEHWTLASWSKAWKALGPSFLRTFELAVPVAVISSVIGAANGFVLSRWRFPGADVVFTLILFGMFIPTRRS